MDDSERQRLIDRIMAKKELSRREGVKSIVGGLLPKDAMVDQADNGVAEIVGKVTGVNGQPTMKVPNDGSMHEGDPAVDFTAGPVNRGRYAQPSIHDNSPSGMDLGKDQWSDMQRDEAATKWSRSAGLNRMNDYQYDEAGNRLEAPKSGPGAAGIPAPVTSKDITADNAQAQADAVALAIGPAGASRNILTQAVTGAATGRLAGAVRERAGGEKGGVGDTLAGGAGAGVLGLAAAPKSVAENIGKSGSSTGRNIRAAEKAGAKVGLRGVDGPSISTIKEHGETAIGKAGQRAQSTALGTIKADEDWLSQRLRQAENEILPSIGSNPAPSARNLRLRLAELIDKGTSSAGGDIDPEVSALRKMLNDSTNGIKRDLTIEDVVKWRRAFDDIGNVGKMEGKNDRPYRELAKAAREIIASDAPELDSAFKQYHAGMNRAEAARDKLTMPDASETQSGDTKATVKERVAQRMGNYGSDKPNQPIKDRALEDVANEFRDIKPLLGDVAATRAREMFRASQIPLALGAVASPPVQARLVYPLRNFNGLGAPGETTRAGALGAAAAGSKRRKDKSK